MADHLLTPYLDQLFLPGPDGISVAKMGITLGILAVAAVGMIVTSVREDRSLRSRR